MSTVALPGMLTSYRDRNSFTHTFILTFYLYSVENGAFCIEESLSDGFWCGYISDDFHDWEYELT